MTDGITFSWNFKFYEENCWSYVDQCKMTISLLTLQRLHQELIGRKSELERLNAAATDTSNSLEPESATGQNVPQSSSGKSRSFTPPAAGCRSRTPPVTSCTRSRTPPSSVARIKTPPVTGTTVRILPSVRSQTPPVSTSQSRAPASQQRRSSTPTGSGAASKTAKSRVPSGSPKRRQLPSPSTAQGSKEPRRSSSALWERYRLLLELSASRKKQLTAALDRQHEVCNNDLLWCDTKVQLWTVWIHWRSIRLTILWHSFFLFIDIIPCDWN